MKKKLTILLRCGCCLILSFCFSIAPAQYKITINTTANSPVNPYIFDALASPVNGISALATNTSTLAPGYLKGKIVRISPPVFTIATRYDLSAPITVPASTTLMIPGATLNASFGNFSSVDVSGAYNDINQLRDSSNGKIKLPPGQYRICFRLINGNLQALSDSNLGCASFNICKADPPQFTIPSSNLIVGNAFTIVQPNSPVNFVWTPPLANCGSLGPINYELEIKEIFNNQAVTDAVNNPFIFRKTGIPSTTFLLDLNLYQNVLQRGKKYVVRVRATKLNFNSPVIIDNNGFSRVEAFQFGTENAVTPNTYGWTAKSWYLPLEKRKSGFWDDYESRKGRDTLVPVDEYMAYKLMQQNIAYSEDAIELLVSLNPELKDKKMVHLYEPLNLPVFPEVPTNLQKDFEATHTSNLKPDAKELTLFRKRLDSLKFVNRSSIPDQFNREYTELLNHLDKFNTDASQLNGTSLNFINTMLSELVFSLRKSTNPASNSNYNHLHGLASDIKALAAIPAGTSFLSKDLFRNGLSLNSRYNGVPALYGSMISVSFYSEEIRNDGQNYYAITDQLLPLNVVVFRPVQEPGKPVMNDPALRNTFRIFYNTANLYNSRNPEIGAKFPGPLASTTQVSLPHGVKYKFWTLNMRTQKLTLPQDIDVDEIFSNSQKKDLKGKKKTIILKVE